LGVGESRWAGGLPGGRVCDHHEERLESGGQWPKAVPVGQGVAAMSGETAAGSGATGPAATGATATGSTGTGATGTGGATPVVAPAATPVVTAPAAPAVPLVKYDDFAKLDLRVARILEAREHPNASKLLLLKIRVGTVEKQIVAGIKGHYEPARLVGTQIVIVNNLEPAMIRGEESNGMLLAGSDETGVVLVRPERELAEGSKVK